MLPHARASQQPSQQSLDRTNMFLLIVVVVSLNGRAGTRLWQGQPGQRLVLMRAAQIHGAVTQAMRLLHCCLESFEQVMT